MGVDKAIGDSVELTGRNLSHARRLVPPNPVNDWLARAGLCAISWLELRKVRGLHKPLRGAMPWQDG
jgi:hypothetical protein